MTARGYRCGGRRERGAALIISLLLLLVMTLIGVTAMQTSTLQERMAGNTRDRNLAFQSAEAALREGEDWVMGNFVVLDDAEPLKLPAAWDGADPAPDGSVDVDAEQLAGPGVFLGGPPRRQRQGIQMGAGGPSFRYFYSVTARGEGGTDTAVVVLRSTVEP
ncbi:MAG: hypothetical protein JJT90_10370 [Ectothiorhodospiraceae bacterium]|nr:hypothetical protein [Ectothiorhodospiraceae bacterium]